MSSRRFVDLVRDALDVRFNVDADSPLFTRDLQGSLADLRNRASSVDEILGNLLNGIDGGAGREPILTGAEIVPPSQAEKREAIQELVKRLSELPQTDTVTALIGEIQALAV
jgi:hypothetical protein